MKKLIIRGYYGRDNLGDELMKETFIRSFNRTDIKLYIMNSAPESLKNEFGLDTPNELVTGGIPGFKNAVKRFFTIVSADLFVFGGGTIITDKHSFFHLLENSVYFFVRRLLGKKSLVVSAGATKFKTGKGLFFAKQLIRFSTYTYIRDDDSFDYLTEITKGSKKLVRSSDMVLLSKDILPKNSDKAEKKYIGLCLMPYYYATFHDNNGDDELLNTLCEQIKIISEKKSGSSFLIIPIQSGLNNDTNYIYSKKAFDILKNEGLDVVFCEGKNNAEKIEALSKCESLISLRLHALMLAKLMGSQVFAVDHNEKIAYFMKRYDSIENSVKLDDADSLAEKFLASVEVDSSDIIEADYETSKGNIEIINKLISD